LICGDKFFAKGLCKKCYYQSPERKAYRKEYRQRPDVKDKRRKTDAIRSQSPERKAYRKEYNQRPDVKDKRRKNDAIHRQSPERKAYLKEYNQRQDVKVAKRAYKEKHKVVIQPEPPLTYMWKEINRQRRRQKSNHVSSTTPEAREKNRLYATKTRNIPHVIARNKKYKQQEKTKAAARLYSEMMRLKPEEKARMKAYNATDKARQMKYRYRDNRLKNDFYFYIQHLCRARFRQVRKALSSPHLKLKAEYIAIANHIGTPPNDGNKYELDHIRPLCSFNLLDPEQIKIAFAPENHRWLLSVENKRKVGADKKQSIRYGKTLVGGV
jgi:hypothetical protein